MTTIRVASVLSVIFVVSSLLIAGLLENAAKIQQAIAYNSILLTKNNNDGALNVGPPEKMTISGESKPPVLSPEKREALEQDQAKIHHNPQLSLSDQAILGPIPGTQAH
jgi:hypothetical protein